VLEGLHIVKFNYANFASGEVFNPKLSLRFKAERHELSLDSFAVEAEGAGGAADRAGASEVATKVLVLEAFFVAKPPGESGPGAGFTAGAAAKALDPA